MVSASNSLFSAPGVSFNPNLRFPPPVTAASAYHHPGVYASTIPPVTSHLSIPSQSSAYHSGHSSSYENYGPNYSIPPPFRPPNPFEFDPDEESEDPQCHPADPTGNAAKIKKYM